MDDDPAVARELHRLRVEHLRASERQLLHLVVRKLGEPLPGGHDSWVGGVHAVDIGADFANLGAERGGERHGGGVASAAAQGGHFLLARDALVAGDDDDPALLQLLDDAHRPDLEDARVGVRAVGDDAALRAGEADRLDAARVERHPQERHRDPLARGEQHVELATVRVGAHLAGEAEQLVRRIAHGAHHHDHLVALLPGLRHPGSHALDALHVRDGGSAVFLDDDAHLARV